MSLTGLFSTFMAAFELILNEAKFSYITYMAHKIVETYVYNFFCFFPLHT